MSLGSFRASGAPHASGRKTIGASSPLLAWTVSTRTPSVSTSMSRLISASACSTAARKKFWSDGAWRCSRASARVRNSSMGSAASQSEPADQRQSAAVFAQEARVKSEGREGLLPTRARWRAGARLQWRFRHSRPRGPRRAVRSVPPRA